MGKITISPAIVKTNMKHVLQQMEFTHQFYNLSYFFLNKPIVWVCFSGRDTHIPGCAGIFAWHPEVISNILKIFIQFVPSKSVYIFGDCAFKSFLFLSHFSYFSPIHSNSTDSPSCAGSLTSRSPICRCPRRNASSDRHRNRRNLLLCRRYRRPSWVGRWGRNHGQNGGGDQTTNEDGDIVPTLSYPS